MRFVSPTNPGIIFNYRTPKKVDIDMVRPEIKILKNFNLIYKRLITLSFV